jgi:hypothetical protein
LVSTATPTSNKVRHGIFLDVEPFKDFRNVWIFFVVLFSSFVPVLLRGWLKIYLWQVLGGRFLFVVTVGRRLRFSKVALSSVNMISSSKKLAVHTSQPKYLGEEIT